MSEDSERVQMGRTQEAGAAGTGDQAQADPELSHGRWQRRFVADAQRAQEAMDLYSQLGYEVRAETVQPHELEAQCEDCQIVTLLQFKTIFTRKS